MTRRPLIVLLLLPLWGCAARPTPDAAAALQEEQPAVAATASDSVEPVPANDYPVVATALVFDLPEATFGQPLDLSRDRRQRMALLGYDEGVSEFYSVWTDDRQREHSGHDRYERRAVSIRTGARYR